MQTSSNIKPESESHPAAKFVTVVWGAAYIERFASLALPSFLAPGNLPALAAETNLEVVILTSRNDIANFRMHDTFKRLQTVCPVSFIDIDDLITNGLYGVTLTLAYARAMFRYGSAMTSTHFVLMNADFILADGSLRSLARHIRAGRSIVLGPSFRSTAEAVEPELERAVDPASGTLVMKPREMVELALAHPHPTTIAKTITQGLCHSDHPNQLFWQIDRQTVLARYFLIFPLCLRPEREVTAINSYIDYCFLPEMCPSGDEAVMDDSDEFFMLELQNSDQERFMVQLGQQTTRDVARRLQAWTTAEHRRAARHDVVFHAGEIPPETQQARRVAQEYVDKVAQHLGKPLPHAFHRHWIGGVRAWKERRSAQGLPASAIEIAPLPARSTLRLLAFHARASIPPAIAFLQRVTRRCARLLLGRPPCVTAFHPEWLDYRFLTSVVDAIPSDSGTRLLVVGRQSETLFQLLQRFDHPRIVTAAEVLKAPASISCADGSITHVLIYLQDRDCRLASTVFRHCRSTVGGDAQFSVLLHNRDGALSGLVIPRIEDMVSSGLSAATTLFSGGRVKWLNQRLWKLLRRLYSRLGVWSLPWVVPAGIVLLPTTLLTNLLYATRVPGDSYLPKCSALLFRIDRLRP